MKAATKSPKHAGLTVKRVRFADTEPHPDNPRIHPPEGSPEYNRLKTSLANEYFDPLVWNKRNGKMVSGHFRRTILIAEGFQTADMVVVDWDEKTHKARMIAANELLGKYDEAKLLALVRDGGLDADLTGLTDEKIRAIIAGAEPPPAPDLAAARLTLSQRFGVPPFSVLDARQGYWQERKRAWLALGIRSEIGRGDNLLKMSDTIKEPDPTKRAAKKEAAKTFGHDPKGATEYSKFKQSKAAATNTTDWVKSKGLSGLAQNIPGTDGEEWSGTSIFDPVLCELAYRWFCPIGGAILDPFAGGSVRGIVAGMLGRQYVGVDLRAEQVAANKEQARRIFKAGKKKAPIKTKSIQPMWITGDSIKITEAVVGALAGEFDFLWTCPPYFDLEVYSSDPRDLSTAKTYRQFRDILTLILSGCGKLMKPNSFAGIVVGDIRDEQGFYRNFVSDTISAFLNAGWRLYNEAILVTSVGSLPIRAGKQFEHSRKLGKTHQNVLFFVKGDPRKATAKIGTVEFGEVPVDETPAMEEPK